jgi:putative endonuclease
LLPAVLATAPVYPVGLLFLQIKYMFYYIYVLISMADNNFYTGYTNDLNKRLKQHNNGEVHATKNRTPLKLIYWEGCLNQQDATRREKYLKSGNGKIYLKSRLRNFFQNPTG